ncbi:MAG: T9SS type A sorting domain-containing protein [bacterium]
MKKVLRICQILILTGIISFLFSLNANGQTYQDSCFRLIWEHNPDKEYYNPDSVMYDSCVCGDVFEYFYNNDRTLPKQYFYAKKWFIVDLPFGALDVPQGSPDTIITRLWSDISTTFSNLRSGLEEMENIFGTYILQKRFPDDVDSSIGTSTVFLIKFDNYVHIDNVIDSLKNITDIMNTGYLRKYDFNPFISVKDNLLINKFVLFPNPASEYIEIIVGVNGSSPVRKHVIQIYNIYGEQLFEQATRLNRNNLPLWIDVSGFPNGIYFIRIGGNFQKFVVLRNN